MSVHLNFLPAHHKRSQKKIQIELMTGSCSQSTINSSNLNLLFPFFFFVCVSFCCYNRGRHLKKQKILKMKTNLMLLSSDKTLTNCLNILESEARRMFKKKLVPVENKKKKDKITTRSKEVF